MGLDSYWEMPPVDQSDIVGMQGCEPCGKITANSESGTCAVCGTPRRSVESMAEIEQRFQPDPVFDPPLRLVGGMLSGHGSQSFRGKVYDGLIESVSGISLYQERMPNDQVLQIAAALDAVASLDHALSSLDGYDVTEPEFNDLKRMFRAYGNAGAQLLGWW